MDQNQIKKTFWNQSIDETLNSLKTTTSGLSEAEAKKRLSLFGPNSLKKTSSHPLLKSLLLKFTNPLVLILLFASLLSGLLGQLAEFSIIVVIIATSIIIDFFQEFKADKASEKLKAKVSLQATVIREGQKKEIPATEITSGDLVFLAAGDIVPADLRLIEVNNLLTDQSTMTGESFPQEKQTATVTLKNPTTAEINNCVFMGTHIISGDAIGAVIDIGSDTEFGKIAAGLAEAKPETEFDRGIRHFGLLLLKFTVVLVLFVFLINALFKGDLLNSFLFSLALAIGLTPELLPVIITINLSKGALRMAKKQVIVKELTAIQNFGGMNVLCTDKTGTLTEDSIILERFENLDAVEDKKVLQFGYINSHFQSGIKSPLEKAILKHQEVSSHQFKLLGELPFDFERKRLSVLVSHQDKHYIISKGAPEPLFEHLKFYEEKGHLIHLQPKTREKIQHRFKELSSKGFRVLMIAYKQTKTKKISHSDESELTFLGLMAFLDPPKQSAKEALALLEKRGIEVKIITGDNELTTEKVCSDLNLPIKGILLGSEINQMSDTQLAQAAMVHTIFARVNPGQKQRIIKAIQKNNKTVGYLGDGINDAPALKTADIGLSVNNAVDIAKETADFILLKKDLHVLNDGVIEGRRIYGNIIKYIKMATSSNFGNMFSMAAASFLLPFLPMLPAQILLNNLLYDLSQLSIASDNVDPQFLESPKIWDIKQIKHFMLCFGPISSLFDFATFGILIVIFKATPSFFQTGWFVESLLTQTIIILAIRTHLIPFFKSRPSSLVIVSVVLICLTALLLPFSPFHTLFSFVPLPLKFFAIVAGFIITYLLVVETAKVWFYNHFKFD